MATLTKLASGRWRAQIRKNGFATQSQTFETKGEAQHWARDTERQMDTNSFSKAQEARVTRVSEIAERYLKEIVAPRSRSETTRMKYFIRTQPFMAKKLSDVTADDIKKYRDGRLETVSKATVSREMNILAGMFTHAIKEWGYTMPFNPVRMVKKPANADVRRDRRVTDDEIERILAAAGFKEGVAPKTGVEYSAWAFLLAIETAMRLGEIVSIKVKDYKSEERHVKLWRTKNGDDRNVPLSTRAMELLDVLVSGKGQNDDIFPYSSDVLGEFFRRVRSASGINGLHFHDTRHEAITRMASKLTNTLELSSVSGHRDPRFLRRYYNPNPQDLAAKLG
jgi:integrase